jgi:hypothetical protein
MSIYYVDPEDIKYDLEGIQSHIRKNLVKIVKLSDVETLTAEHQKMKEGLEFYADEKNWCKDEMGYQPIYFIKPKKEKTGGESARTALQQIKEQ